MKIAFTYPEKPSIFSKLIRWFTKSKWSHCIIILDDDLQGDALITEASATGGVRINLLSKYNKHHIEIYEILNWKNPNIKSLHQYIGYKYGYLQVIGYMVMKLFNLKSNPFTLDIWCSEWAHKVLLASPHKHHFDRLEPNTVVPEDLYTIILGNSNFRRT